MEKQNEDEEITEQPTPDDFCKYLPWACNQLQIASSVVVTKVFQNEYVSVVLTDRSKKGKSKLKAVQSRYDSNMDQEKEENSPSGLFQLAEDENIVGILAIYDSLNKLVEIKFEKNRKIPRIVLKIIGIIICFYPNLNRVVIDKGIDKYTVYEINKFLKMSNITEIILDDTYLSEANYYILLDTDNSLRHLSLSRCKINDDVVHEISKRLIYPLSASKTLLILNLCTNRISDVGAQYLAKALRCNQKLAYLNLADNLITDEGACSILSSLSEFALTSEEILDARSRHMLFMNEKSIYIEQVMKDLRASEFEKKMAKRKSMKPTVAVTGKKGKLEKETSLKSLVDPNSRSFPNLAVIFYDKAVAMAENVFGEFNDPYSSYNTVSRDGVIYCLGNNILLCLNLAYNNLSYLSMKMLLDVLLQQKTLDRKPKGLINVSIEGNFLPVACKELAQIENILESGLMNLNRRASTTKKKGQSKGTSK